MRWFDWVLIAISALLVLLIAFGPIGLSGSGEAARVQRECELFYGSLGSAAIEDCRRKMGGRDASSTPP